MPIEKKIGKLSDGSDFIMYFFKNLPKILVVIALTIVVADFLWVLLFITP